MRCRSALTRIDALRTGELALPEKAEVHEHLKTCSSCDESVADIEQLASAVKSLITSPPRPLHDYYDRVDNVWVAFSDRGLRMITARTLDDLRAGYESRYGRTLEKHPLPERLRKQVHAAVSGQDVDRCAIDIDPSSLEEKVMQKLMEIPRGEVRTYGWLAAQIGKPKAVRAVANYVARNVVPFVVPCHRVVPASGGVGNYAYGGSMKRELLKREGVDVDKLEALAREGTRYIGSRTTKIFCFPTCRDARRIREDNLVPFHDADEAREEGFRPCKRCQPIAA
jgi:O-6-methylguanine DNA methyltransferase